MKCARAILAGLIALSLATLPVAAAEMRGAMAAGMSSHAEAHADCCSDAEPCEKQKGCDHSGACAVKCSLIPAAIVTGTDLTGPAPRPVRSVPIAGHFRSALEHPPLPPPRI